MSDSRRKAQEGVVEAVSNDYEDLELIFDQVLPWAREEGLPISRSEFIEALEWAINVGYIKAYLLFPRAPHVKEFDYSRDQIDDLWFYATPKGKRFVAAIG